MKNIVKELEQQGVIPCDIYVEAYEGKKPDTYVVRTKSMKWGIISKEMALLPSNLAKIQKDEKGNHICVGLTGIEAYNNVRQ